MTTHDYTVRYWGHDYSIQLIEGETMLMMGWGLEITPGDYLMLFNERIQRLVYYEVTEIDYFIDPIDMWTATVQFVPRP